MLLHHLTILWKKNQISKQVTPAVIASAYPDNILDLPLFFLALNLILCYYVISDREKLKRTFQRTLSISTGLNDEDRYYLAMVSGTAKFGGENFFIHFDVCT